MNLQELDNYRLSDAIKFHDRLNHRLWDRSEHLHPAVKEKLLEIAADFQEFLGVSNLDVKDITISGSNAAYNYTPTSDIDLHLVVDLPEADKSEVFRELFDAKKYQYNDMHNIKIGGYDVELYVQNPHEEHHSQGIYSLLKNSWISVPKRRKPEVDDVSVRSKAEDLAARIDDAVESKDYNRIATLQKKIKAMRKAGLEREGEYGSDNLAFKVLRNQGYIKKLVDARNFARDLELSLAEMNKPKQRVRYGFFEDNTGMAQGSSDGDAGAQSTWDGVSPDTQEFLSENDEDHADIVHDFILDTADQLGIRRLPRIEIHHDPEWSQENKSFGMYQPESHTLHVSLSNRHLLDILRTTAHELAHCAQHQNEALPDEAGDTGSRWENEAHAVAGIIMRGFADKHPELFMRQEIDEGIMSKAGAAAALATAMALTPAQAQEYLPPEQQQQVQVQQQLNPLQILNIARTIYALKHNVTRAGAEEEINQEFKNYLRAQQGDPGAQNQSRLWQIQQRRQQAQQPQQPWTGNQYQRESVSESSGYIPTEAEKNDPRFVMALSPDVRPGATGKNANKMSLKTNAQGKPALLMKTVNLRESLAAEFESFNEGKSYGYNSTPLSQVPGEREDELGNQEATGPEFPPQMPAGTTKIDVSDLTDWYRLGQDISDLDDADPEDYGKGPPQTVVVFPSDQAEQGYLKQFKRLGLKTHDLDPDVPGGEDVKGKHLRNKLAEDYKLFEINMSPSNLRKEAAKTGALAGMEFEMYVPGIGREELEPEPDMEYDESCQDISDIIRFFDDSDHNTSRTIRDLSQELNSAFDEYRWEQLGEMWDSDGLDYLRDYIANNDLFDRDDAFETARDEFIDANPGIPIESEEAQQGISARVDEMEQQFVEHTWDLGIGGDSDIYDQAQQEFNDAHMDQVDEGDWLSSQGYNYMSDIRNNFDVSWPYWTEGSTGEADVDAIAQDFSEAVGKPVKTSSGYHSYNVKRQDAGSNFYIIEPDSSLDEPDELGDAGLEFVSPPLPLDEMIDQLKKVKEWAGRNGVYTNDTTGLHINVSIPNYSTDKLDYVKLALLLGDEHVLKEFDRLGNYYCKSALSKVQGLVKEKPEKAKVLLDKMRNHMEDLASKAIHDGTTDKYTSINTKTGRIEFRSPGDDWLDAKFDKIENTLLRFATAMTAAVDPKAYRQEYLKKLYKLLDPSGGESKGTSGKGYKDTVKYFADYVAGKTPKAALRSFVKQAQLTRKIEREKNISGKYWWNVELNGQRIEVVATSKDDAWDKATDEYQEWMRYNKNQATITPLRPYQDPEKQAGQPQQTNQGNWGIWITSANRFANQPGEYRRGTEIPLYRFPSREAAEQWITQQRAERPGMRTDIEVREIGPDGRPQIDSATSQTDMENRMGLPDQTGDANWEIVDRRTGRRVFVMIANTEYDARRKYADWLSAAGYPIETEDYGFREIRPAAQDEFRSTENVPREGRPRNLVPTGPGPWEIYRISSNRSVRDLASTDRQEAEQEARNALGWRGEAPDLYGVRTRSEPIPGSTLDLARQRAAQSNPYQPVPIPGVIDVELDIPLASRDTSQGGLIDVAGEQPATPRTLTVPGQGQQVFTGEWDVVMGGEVVFRVRGETQGIANQAAQQWILGRSREFLHDHQGQEVEVVPRYA